MCPFSVSNVGIVFVCIFKPTVSNSPSPLEHFGSVFYIFASFVRVSFSHRVVIDLGMDVGLIVDVCVDIVSVHARNLQTLKKYCLYNEFSCFYPSEKHNV